MNNNIKAFAESMSQEELRQKGSEIVRMVESIKALQAELAKKKLEIAPFVINQPLELEKGTISYVKSSEGMTLSRKTLKSVLMQRLKISETAAESLLSSASNKKIIDAYIKILVKKSKIPQVAGQPATPVPTTSQQPVKMSDIYKMIKTFADTLEDIKQMTVSKVEQETMDIINQDPDVVNLIKVQESLNNEINQLAKKMPTFGRLKASGNKYSVQMQELCKKLAKVNSDLDTIQKQKLSIYLNKNRMNKDNSNKIDKAVVSTTEMSDLSSDKDILALADEKLKLESNAKSKHVTQQTALNKILAEKPYLAQAYRVLVDEVKKEEDKIRNSKEYKDLDEKIDANNRILKNTKLPPTKDVTKTLTEEIKGLESQKNKLLESLESKKVILENFKNKPDDEAIIADMMNATEKGAKIREDMLKPSPQATAQKITVDLEKKLKDPNVSISEKLSLLFTKDIESKTGGLIPTEKYLMDIVKGELKDLPFSYINKMVKDGSTAMRVAQTGYKDNAFINIFQNKMENIGKIYQEIKIKYPEIEKLSPEAKTVIAERIMREPNKTITDIVNDAKGKITDASGNIIPEKISAYEKNLELQQKIYDKQDEQSAAESMSKSVLVLPDQQLKYKNQALKLKAEADALDDERTGYAKVKPLLDNVDSIQKQIDVIKAKDDKYESALNGANTQTRTKLNKEHADNMAKLKQLEADKLKAEDALSTTGNELLKSNPDLSSNPRVRAYLDEVKKYNITKAEEQEKKIADKRWIDSADKTIEQQIKDIKAKDADNKTLRDKVDPKDIQTLAKLDDEHAQNLVKLQKLEDIRVQAKNQEPISSQIKDVAMKELENFRNRITSEAYEKAKADISSAKNNSELIIAEQYKKGRTSMTPEEELRMQKNIAKVSGETKAEERISELELVKQKGSELAVLDYYRSKGNIADDVYNDIKNKMQNARNDIELNNAVYESRRNLQNLSPVEEQRVGKIEVTPKPKEANLFTRLATIRPSQLKEGQTYEDAQNEALTNEIDNIATKYGIDPNDVALWKDSTLDWNNQNNLQRAVRNIELFDNFAKANSKVAEKEQAIQKSIASVKKDIPQPIQEVAQPIAQPVTTPKPATPVVIISNAQKEAERNAVSVIINHIAEKYNVAQNDISGWISSALSAYDTGGKPSAKQVIDNFESSAKQKEQEKNNISASKTNEIEQPISQHQATSNVNPYAPAEESDDDNILMANDTRASIRPASVRQNKSFIQMPEVGGNSGDAVIEMNKQIANTNHALGMALDELTYVKSLNDASLLGAFEKKYNTINNNLNELKQKRAELLR